MEFEKMERNGEVCIVLPLHIYEKLAEDAEMLEDIRAFDAAIARNEPALPLEVWNAFESSVSKGMVALRKWRGMSQMQLASATGIKQSLISDIENGKKQGSITTMKAIAQALDVPLDILA
ncbi:MAG: XRE family transcriptional regulator [Alphaproteobacteria bacterium]|nr:MAG: XRE family transcriptional regulator [Alphaproteobacteria bacterium]TAF15230.1 MAG: XRE family transcriptional regulator [Alphaproteobacteria bacterium]TAF38995.1 MAG: XRE family transcriptional regulator [Alphaproteobacteria bacterium]TAF76304.1 MAG: XRE family transcriptional regulator [Alphaproteobacteria bacterium]